MIDVTCTLVNHAPSSSNAKTHKDSIDTIILEDNDEVLASKEDNYAVVSIMTYIRSVGGMTSYATQATRELH